MKQIFYGFKASPVIDGQIENRLKISEELGLNYFFCELYLDEVDICNERIKEKIVKYPSAIGGKYSLHIPIVNHKDKFSDPSDLGWDYIDHLAEIATKLNNCFIILHRCWKFNAEIQWEDAEERFLDWIWQVSKKYPELTFIIENFGFVFRKISGILNIYLSPLDHSFPQEIHRFKKQLMDRDITNVYPFLDVAHANLTLNLLKAWKLNRSEAIKYIHKSLHDKIDDKIFYLNQIEDNISGDLFPYFHINDSCSLPSNANPSTWLDYFMSEGLIPGSGDINWEILLTKIYKTYDNVTFIMETNMLNPSNAIEQKKGIDFIREVMRSLNKE